MRLRKLELKDAEYMLEWMHDAEIVNYLGTNFSEKTLDDCYQFIKLNEKSSKDVNFAIVDDKDEYMGTVSLKHINRKKGTAEFAIGLRKCAMGRGYAAYGMDRILNEGVQEYGLEQIYWCVFKNNIRAIRFYDKNGYDRVEGVPDHIKNLYSEEKNRDFIWYAYTTNGI